MELLIFIRVLQGFSIHVFIMVHPGLLQLFKVDIPWDPYGPVVYLGKPLLLFLKFALAGDVSLVNVRNWVSESRYTSKVR